MSWGTILKFTIKGLVQGIGYRPFVVQKAEALGLGGFVRNTDGIVTIVAAGDETVLFSFEKELLENPPKGAKVTEFKKETISEENFLKLLGDMGRDGITASNPLFFIAESNKGENYSVPYIPADIATCDICQKELRDKNNRRFRHPFISCTSCGPRYSIINELPYDRERITMEKFVMCDKCETEYTAKNDRRRHAQTIACKDCGPRLGFSSFEGGVCKYTFSPAEATLGSDEELIGRAVLHLKEGGILAVMDIGGFHLAALASSPEATQALRQLKGRKKKPFAVMFETVADVKEFASVNEMEERELVSSARPVVLLKRKNNEMLAEAVCGESPSVGAMLPCNPLQMLLVHECGPLIMTSANQSGDLMITDPGEMCEFMRMKSAKTDGDRLCVLYHDRPIITPLDDSVVRVVKDRRIIIRRARGFVPEPIFTKTIKGPSMFAAGGDMKATFAYYKNDRVILSAPFGDIESEEAREAYEKEKERMSALFGIKPDRTYSDRHPGYFTHSFGENHIFHHEAHVASVLAEYGIEGEAIGIAFDGTGYGNDGTVFGSEFFHWNGNKMNRFAALRSVKLIGGNEGARNCETILSGFITDASSNTEKDSLPNDGQCMNAFDSLLPQNYALIKSAIEAGINTVSSSSMGRLFDAASCLLGICAYSEYEGEAAIELEYTASKANNCDEPSLVMKSVSEDGMLRGDSTELLVQLAKKLSSGKSKESLAKEFIEAIGNWVVDICKSEIGDKKIPVLLSGGTFQNGLLLEHVISGLEEADIKACIGQQVPPGDGGLALGQLYLGSRAEKEV